jgi:uncharacterized protein
MANRLASETSPYLLQHRDNPVDWYPWGEEAMARARSEDLPILLSVGYSACHWCHVMEHESFADPETARLMNEWFVNVKVDREERPDVDALYMQAVQQMTGHGGWPMTVFLTPDGRPFYGGTYFPPEPRHGLPSFRQLLQAIHTAYRERREEVERSAEELRETLGRGMSVNPEPGAVDAALLQRAFHGLGSRFDHRLGGFGGAPKFPQPMVLEFLLRYGAFTGVREAHGMVERTLDAMAAGGIYDHLGGGFHRYSVDARWLVPHFEKMLYDNALLARVYVRAHHATGKASYRRVATEVLGYVEREMTDPSGGFYSSQDADSEGVEGRFYVWSAEEIDEVLGAGDGPLFRRYFDVSRSGNWDGVNILNTPAPLEEVAREGGVDPDRLGEIVERGRVALHARRSERVWPGRDEKVLTSWNAMMLQAFAEAGRVFGETRYVRRAEASAEFLLRELRPKGRLLRTWRDGSARIDAFLEDHATLVDGLIDLYLATWDPRWVREARAIADGMIDRFWSPAEEIFYDTPADAGGLILRTRDIYDNATPSGNSSATLALTRLARLSGESGYERIASRVVRGMGEIASRVPQGFGQLLAAAIGHVAPSMEIAILGDPKAPDTLGLVEAVHARFLPEATVALRPQGAAGDEAEAEMPLLAHREMVDGRATAFVCRHYSCRQPVTTPTDLLAEIEAAGFAAG